MEFCSYKLLVQENWVWMKINFNSKDSVNASVISKTNGVGAVHLVNYKRPEKLMYSLINGPYLVETMNQERDTCDIINCYLLNYCASLDKSISIMPAYFQRLYTESPVSENVDNQQCPL